jgi:hypothetical protein
MMQRLSLWGALVAIILGSAGCYVVPVQEAVPPPPSAYPVQTAPTAPSPSHGYVGPTDPQRTPPSVYVLAPPEAPPPPVLIPR